MPKIEIAKVNTPLNSHEFQAQINRNFEKVSEALDNQLQRTAQEDVVNSMEQELDMGGNRIINLAKAVDPSDAMRKKEFDEKIANIEQWSQEAKDSAASAAEDEALAAEHRRVAVSAAQSAQEHERQTQELFDALMSDDSIPVVAENIEDVKAVGGSIDNVNIAAENLEDIKSVFDIAKRIAYGNIGDIRATFAATAPEGCRFTDGTEIKKEDYPELFEMLEKGGMPHDSIATWTSNVNSKGITGAFGYDKGATTARLPLLTEAFVEATNNTPHRVNDAGLPNITGWGYTGGEDHDRSPDSGAPSGGALYSYRGQSSMRNTGGDYGDALVLAIDASRSSSVYGKSDTVQPKSIMLRHYVVLTNSRQMILTMRTSVSKKSDLPKTGNINGDIRVVTSEGIAYVWARSSATTWMWSSIGKVGTSGSGVVEWVDIQGDITQNKDLTQALDKKLTNAATGDYSLTLFGTSTSAPNAINVGYLSSATANSISLGRYAASISGGIAIGTEASSIGTQVTTEYPIPTYNIAIGTYAKTHQQETGRNSSGNIAIGHSAQTRGGMSTAIGYRAYVEADNAIQLGQGSNTTEGSLQFLNYPLVDANGKIPAERLPDDIGGGYKTLDETQKATALNEGTYEGVAIEDGEVFTEYDGKFVEFKNEPTEGKPPVQVTQPIAGSVFGHGGRVIIWPRSGTTGYYSDDSGSTWNTFTVPFAEATKFAHNGSLWMAATSFYTATSSDGITWTQGAGFPNQYASYLGSFKGKFYTYYQAAFWYSENGSSWTQGTSPVSGDIVLLCRDEDIIIFGADGDIYKSTDAVSWEALGVSLGISDWNQIYAKAYYVLGKTVLKHSFGGSSATKYSTNLTDWTTISSQPYDSNSIVEVNASLAISTNMSSTSKSEFYKTTDGISWTTVTTPSSFTYSRAAATSDGTFYVFQQRSTTGFVGKAGTSYSFKDLSYTKAEVDAAIAGVDLTGYLKNLSKANGSLSIAGTASTSTYSTNIGVGSTAKSNGTGLGYYAHADGIGAIAIGTGDNATYTQATGFHSIAIGPGGSGYAATKATASYAIQLGHGTNSEADTFNVGFSSNRNYKLLGSDGKIPVERLPDDIGGSSDLTETAYAGEGIRLVTEPVENYEIQGTSVVVSDDYIASSFTGSSYIKHNVGSLEAPKGLAFEATFSVSSVAATQVLQLRNSGNSVVGRLALNANGSIVGGIGSATLTSASTFTTGQKVSAKLVYDTQTMSLYSKVDGGEWTLERSNSLSPDASTIADVVATSVVLGLNATTATIYLPECAISYQGKEVWRAVEGLGKTGIAVDILDTDGKIPSARLPENSFFAPATGTWTALTLGASNTEYEAPANGYFVLYAQQSDGNEKFISMRNKSTYGEVLGADHYWNTTFGAARLFVPAKKGHKIVVEYNCSLKSLWFGFIPADGTS
ncbi:MAG: hypothetical protein J6Q39_03975 [Bacteroidales bacterium]|nr:hypothetical protein [Bacteroidales bacterium]